MPNTPIPPRIRLDVNNMMAERVGWQYGVAQETIGRWQPSAVQAQHAVQAARGTGMLGWTELPVTQDAVVQDVLQTASDVRRRFESFVLLGIGGSALGPIAMQKALNPMHYNELPKDQRGGGPKLYFEDNIDPERMYGLLRVIDPATTCFNVITKSGATAETMSQYLIVRQMIQHLPDWQSQIIATTSESQGNLIRIARQEGFKTFYIPDGVGGRFSQLCPVGLLAAAVGGIDVKGLLAGAADMDRRCATDDIWQNPALLEALLMAVTIVEMGKNIHVMMPYADSLHSVADWFCQLWAESLGKNVTRKGRAINVGQTPVKALGVTDQHSQLQLYTEGPFDKVITMVQVERFRAQTEVPPVPPELNYPEDTVFLGGKSHNQMIEAERQGTEYALMRAGRMNQTIIMPEVTAHTLGQLMYFLEMATAYLGELLDVNVFNQPGVEESKIATFALMDHPSAKFARKRKEMEMEPARQARYVLS